MTWIDGKICLMEYQEKCNDNENDNDDDIDNNNNNKHNKTERKQDK